MGIYLSTLYRRPAVVVKSLIPDTSDGSYWKLKEDNGERKYVVYVPRDKAKHKRLLRQQRANVQAETERQQQLARGSQSILLTNRAVWGLTADRATVPNRAA